MWIVDTHRIIVPNDEDGRRLAEQHKALGECKISETTTAITIETVEIRQVFWAERREP